MIWLAVVFALASAATTALSTSTQHLATGKAPDGSGVLALMRFLVRRPEWLLALCLGPVGFTFHVLALDNGPIALVQPIAIMGIVFAVPIRAALARSWPSRDELLAVSVTALAIAALLLATDVRQTGHSPAPLLMVAAPPPPSWPSLRWPWPARRGGRQHARSCSAAPLAFSSG